MLKVLCTISKKQQTRCEIGMLADDQATIKIVGAIDWWRNNSEIFTAKLEEIKAAGIKKLHCYINSPGGSAYEANEIYNQIRAFEGTRTLKIGAICASAASIIAMAFDKDDTEGAPNLTYMVHNPRTSVLDAEVKELESAISLLTNTKETVSKLYQKRTGQSKSWINNKMDATWWMTAEMAKQYGFIGKITGEDESLPEDTGDVVNRYHFENVPSVLNSAIIKEGKNAGDVEKEKVKKPKPEETKTDLTKITMKNFLTLLLATMPGLKDFIKSENEAEVVAGLNQYITAKDAKLLEVNNNLTTEKARADSLALQMKTQETLTIKATLAAAVEAKKITPDQSVEFEKQSTTIGLAGLNAILATMTPRASLKDINQGNAGGNGNKEGEGGNEIPKPKNLDQSIALRLAQMNAADAGKKS